MLHSTTLDFTKICRSCMSESTDLRSIYERNEDSIQYSDMLTTCTDIQIATEDGLPSHICVKCEAFLNTAYSFKQQCERTDEALREYMSRVPTQEEPDTLDIIIKPEIDLESMYRLESSDSEVKYTKSTDYPCRYCDKVLQTRAGVKLHERKHTGENLKTCPICNATFIKTNHLTRHIALHNRPPGEHTHTCEECGISFTRAYHLLQHKREHRTDQEPTCTTKRKNCDLQQLKLRLRKEFADKDFRCAECNKNFKTPEGLQIHMRRHTGLNLSTCHICYKAFTKRSHLIRHMRIHGVPALPKTKDTVPEPKPQTMFECELCDRKFIYRKSFRHHLQQGHQILEGDTAHDIVPKIEESDECLQN